MKRIFNCKSFLTFIVFLAILILYQIVSRHLYHFGDERSFLQNVEAFIKNRNIIPVYTRYPTLYSYIITGPIFAVYILLILAKGFPLTAVGDPILFEFMFQESTMVWVWVSRLITMLFAAGTTVVVMRKGFKDFGFLPACVMLGLLVFDPFKAYFRQAVYGLPDVPVAFLVTVSMFLLYEFSDRRKVKLVYTAAFFSGLAASMKINGALMIFPLAVAVISTPLSGKNRVGRLAKSFGIFIAGFFLGTPLLLFSPQIYFQGFAYEMNMLTQTGWQGSSGQNWLWIPLRLWEKAPGAVCCFAASIIYMCAKRQRRHILYLSLLFFSVLILGVLKKKTLTYLVILYPISVYHLGECLRWAISMVNHVFIKRIVQAVIVFVLVILPANKFVFGVGEMMRPDNRIEAGRWIEMNIPHGARILVDEVYLPKIYVKDQLEGYLGKVLSSGSRYAQEISRYYLNRPSYYVDYFVDLGYKCDGLRETGAEYLIVSSWDFERYLEKDKSKMPLEGTALYNDLVRGRKFYKCVLGGESGFSKIKEFSASSGPDIFIFEKEKGF